MGDDDNEVEGGGILDWIGRKLRAAVLPSLFLACCGYFVWHAIHGERGLIAKEERARTLLGRVHRNDLVIITGP